MNIWTMIRNAMSVTLAMYPVVLMLGIVGNASGQRRDRYQIYVSPGRELTQKELSTATKVCFVPRTVDDNGAKVPLTEPTDDDLKHIEAIQNLNSVQLYGNSVTEKGIEELVSVKKLSSYVHNDMKGADNKLRALAKCNSLTILEIDGSDITNASSKYIAQLKQLTYVDLSNTAIDMAFFKNTPLANKVTHLKLDGTEVDSGIIDLLPESITHLSLSSTDVDESAVPKFAARKNLKVLTVPRKAISQKSIEWLKSQLPDAKINEELNFMAF